jgi:hypothetical protein
MGSQLSATIYGAELGATVYDAELGAMIFGAEVAATSAPDRWARGVSAL